MRTLYSLFYFGIFKHINKIGGETDIFPPLKQNKNMRAPMQAINVPGDREDSILEICASFIFEI